MPGYSFISYEVICCPNKFFPNLACPRPVSQMVPDAGRRLIAAYVVLEPADPDGGRKVRTLIDAPAESGRNAQ